MSTNTGTAPIRWMQPPVAKKVYGVVMISSPGWTPRAISETNSASVPEVTPTPKGHCEYAAISFSRPSTSGPPMKACASATRSNAARHSSRIGAYWAFRSNRGIGWV